MPGVNPASSVPGEESAAGQGESDSVELGMDARSRLGTEASQAGAVSNEGGLLALLDGLAVHLGDEVDDAHAGEQRGIDGVVLVVGLGDGTEPLGMGEHEMAGRPIEQIVEPGPRGAGLDDDLERLEGLKDAAELADLPIADTHGLLHQRSAVAHDRDDDVRCVSVDSCDMHGGLLMVDSRRFLGKNPA